MQCQIFIKKKNNLKPDCQKNYRFLPIKYSGVHCVSANYLSTETALSHRRISITETAVVRVLNEIDLLRNSDIGHLSILSVIDLSAAMTL